MPLNEINSLQLSPVCPNQRLVWHELSFNSKILTVSTWLPLCLCICAPNRVLLLHWFWFSVHIKLIHALTQPNYNECAIPKTTVSHTLVSVLAPMNWIHYLICLKEKKWRHTWGHRHVPGIRKLGISAIRKLGITQMSSIGFVRR